VKVKYIGPYAEGVFVPAANCDVPAGGVIEVDDELGAALCRQTTTWQPVQAAKPKTTTTATPEEG
jgi:D-arabinose 1-dehydrogenase-like Zn-dependent alcohol dehydrogenase